MPLSEGAHTLQSRCRGRLIGPGGGAIGVKLFDLIGGISGALDLICPQVVGHHRRVGALAAALGAALGLPGADRTDLLAAGLLHDVGAFSLRCRIDTLEFETKNTEHAETGFRLLRTSPLLSRAARIVRFHHAAWQAFENLREDPEILFLANVLNLADRVDVSVRHDQDILEQVSPVYERIKALTGKAFAPEAVDGFLKLAPREEFWRALEDPAAGLAILVPDGFAERELDDPSLMDFSRCFSQIIDFRSRFTATHSRGVAATAAALAGLLDLPRGMTERLVLAGNLHDLGKLAVPSEILEKPAALDPGEFEIMRRHALVSSEVLGAVAGLEDVARWAGRHHERLDGRGYPQGLAGETLTRGCRILAVADVFTAVSEDRPYRPGMSETQVRTVLSRDAGRGGLDAGVVGELLANYDDVSAARAGAQAEAGREFRAFYH